MHTSNREEENIMAVPLLLTADQVAMLLQISTRTLWRMVSSKDVIAPIHIRGNTRWQREPLEQWIAAGCPAVTARENGSRR